MAEATVRAYVREKKLKIGLIRRETFVPQSYTWGQEGRVDWYEMYAELGGETQKAQMFCLSSMASAGAFHRAYSQLIPWGCILIGRPFSARGFSRRPSRRRGIGQATCRYSFG